MLKYDRLFCTHFLRREIFVRTVIEDHTIHKYFCNSSALVTSRCSKAVYQSLLVYIQTTSEEATTSPHHQFGRDKGIFYRTIRRTLRNKTTGRRRRVLPLSQTINAVVEEYYIKVDITTHCMNKVVTPDSQAITIA